MSQRNPLNERYQGDGPGGKTRRSAASIKPRTEAASSVYIRSKPTTASEKRAAAKAREKEAQRKADERAKRAAARQAAKAEAEAETGTVSEAATDESVQDKDKAIKAEKAEKPSKAVEPEKKGFFAALTQPAPGMPNSEEYKKWRRIYWILMAIGVATVIITFIMNYAFKSTASIWVIAVAYVAIIGAFLVEFRKVRPLIKAYQAKQNGGNKSPKQLKHEKEAAEQAAALEAARKAAKQAKKPSRRKPKDTVVPGEEQ